jgi:hypothetical protein
MKKKPANAPKTTPASKELVIGKKSKQQLSKSQQAFNRLVKKLEKLRKELEQTSKTLSQKLDFYGKEIHPLEQKLTERRTEGVKLFYKFYRDKKLLSKKDKEVLLEIMSQQLNGIFQFSSEEPDAELQEIFELVEGLSFEEAKAEDFATLKNEMAETFENLGFDININDFHQDMDEAEMMRKMAEMLGEMQEQAEAKDAERPQRKKTKKQLEKEAREQQVEEAKNKNISTIYKQLARAFHPDLEQDPQLKADKEVLMKQLTAAYEKGDLHTLLRLELEWIHREEDNLDKLSDDKLSIYNQVLKEQVAEIETEIMMLFHHPRYHPLRRFAMFPSALKHVDLKDEKRELEETIDAIEDSIEKLQGKNAVKELKTIIRYFKQPKPVFNLFDLDLDELFR